MRKRIYEGSLNAFGVIASLSFKVETPKRRFFFDANAYQIAPLILSKELTETDENGNEVVVSLTGNTEDGKVPSKTEYLPLRTGFAFDASIGFRF